MTDGPTTDQLLDAACRSRADLSAALAVLEAPPEDWTRPDYVAMWVRAARHRSDLLIIEAQLLRRREAAVARLERASRLGAVRVPPWALAAGMAGLMIGLWCG